MLGRHGLRDGVGILREHRDQLLDEQRIALRCRDDAIVHGRTERLLGHERVDELGGCGGVEWFEDDECHAGTRRSPRWPHVEEIGPRRAEKEDRHTAGRRGDVLDEVEERRLRPVEVVDDDHERPLRRNCLEEAPKRPGSLLGRTAALAQTHRPGNQTRRHLAVLDRLEQSDELLLGIVAADVAHDVCERQVGDALAVRGAAADHDPGLLAQRPDQLAREPGLPDAGRANDRGQRAAARRHCGVECGAESDQLLPSSHERSCDRNAERGYVRARRDQPVRRDGFALPSCVDGRRGLGVHRPGDRREGRRTQQHLAGRCCLLEPGGDVDGVAGRELLVASATPDDDLARVDAGARRDPDAVVALELGVQGPE